MCATTPDTLESWCSGKLFSCSVVPVVFTALLEDFLDAPLPCSRKKQYIFGGESSSPTVSAIGSRKPSLGWALFWLSPPLKDRVKPSIQIDPQSLA